MKSRPYRGYADLEKMKALLIRGRAARPHSGYPHVGDLLWWLFFILRDFELRKIVRLWEREDGDLAGWALLSPPLAAFNVFVQPEERGGSREEGIFAWAEERMQTIARDRGEKSLIVDFVFADDDARTALLTRRAFVRTEDRLAYLVRNLADPLPRREPPQGFIIRSLAGKREADPRAEASYATFHPETDRAERARDPLRRRRAAAYRRLMRAPGYDIALDLVAVGPDEEVAAFATGWLDSLNHVGEFEPVGTRPGHHRKGLGRALLLEGLRRMKARGARSAIVYSEASNAASRGLYASVGFRPVNTLHTYFRPV